ncbi:hypothetical protein D3C77_631590 [compost metagenome]
MTPVNSPSAASIGLDSGTMMEYSTFGAVAPSSSADSISASGMPCMNFSMTNIFQAENALGKM